MICKRCGGTMSKRGTQGDRQRYSCQDCGAWDSNKLESRVLIIPDLHAPFIKEGYLEFTKELYDKYDCNQVVQIGDLFDGHYTSFHPSDPDGYGENEEFMRAVSYIAQLADLYPEMTVTLGNHDSHAARKNFNSGISNRWLKTIDEVLYEIGLPIEKWDFVNHKVIDNVMYTHGMGMQAKARMIRDHRSVVQGHWHSRTSVEWAVTESDRTFAMQLGAGIDDKAYAFAYAKYGPRTHINAGVVINGEVPVIEYM